MLLGNIIGFRNDIFFEGAVQADWFYNPDKSTLVADNYIFHGENYYGVSDSCGSKKYTDTVRFVFDISKKVYDDQHTNPLTLAIAGYGTGKSHLAVTLAELLSGSKYHPKTHNNIISNISSIDKEKGTEIQKYTQRPNLVLVINGMRDFNLNYEILKSAQKSLKLYGYSDEKLKTLNRALETAMRFFERNAEKSISLFEKYAPKFGYPEKGSMLIQKIREQLGEDESAFNIINAVYEEINGNEIRWDEGVSASSVLETLNTEYCGVSGYFNKVILVFDEFGRYLEYASSVNLALSGNSALQQIFETIQNAEGNIQLVAFIQSDIKTYLQRVDQTSSISRYIGRYDASEKYYLSSNLETIFANLIERNDQTNFSNIIQSWQTQKEAVWKDIFSSMERWFPTKGVWKDYPLFRKVIVEGIYPLHPVSTYMLSQLSDYLQNRSSLMLLNRYISELADYDLDKDIPLVYPSTMLEGDIYTEILAAEEEGRQYSQHCIRFNNILRKYDDKLSNDAKTVLRANLALRILRGRTENYEDVKKALSMFSGLSIIQVTQELDWLENEYAVLGYDEQSACFDFLEDSSGAHDFRTLFRRIRANTNFSYSIFDQPVIRELSETLSPIQTNFNISHAIRTNEWQFEQNLYSVSDLNNTIIDESIRNWENATTADRIKGKIIWLYIDKDNSADALDNAIKISSKLEKKPIILMLLNDKDSRLKNALIDYSALQNISEQDKEKFGRHYNDKLQQVEDSVQASFDSLKKERNLITPEGVVNLKSRLPIALTSLFDEIYPEVVPFDFDGFDSKQPGKARKLYCSIVGLLLTGSVSENTIHSFPSEVRNRVEATLSATGAFSWKVITNDYQIMHPENPKVAAIYEKITNSLPEGGNLNLSHLMKMLMAPPYGMSDYVALYLIVVICVNLNYCLRAVIDDSVYSMISWKDIIIQENRIDFEKLGKTIIKRVNAGLVSDLYLQLFAQINNNRDIEKVELLSQKLKELQQAEELPDELKDQCLLAKYRLEEGANIRLQWGRVYEDVMKKYDLLIQNRDIYKGLQAIQQLRSNDFINCFSGQHYKISDNQIEFLKNKEFEIKQTVEPFIPGWINEQRCMNVTGIQDYSKHMKRLENLLKALEYHEFANRVRNQAEKELDNIEEIRARQYLRNDCENFIASCTMLESAPYTTLLDWKKQSIALLERLDKYSTSLGDDAKRYKSLILSIQKKISELTDTIQKEMNAIYDDLYDVGSLEDIRSINRRIEIILKKGISEQDMQDFASLSDSLKDLISKLSQLSEITNDRSLLTETFNNLKSELSISDYDFDVLPIIDGIANKNFAQMDNLETNWKDRYLALPCGDRNALLTWMDRTRVLPVFLSEKTIEEYLELKKKVSQMLSQAKIDDVVFSFKNLNHQEQLDCLDILQKMTAS